MPNYIVEDDYSDMPYELFARDMEIPVADLQLDGRYLGSEVYVVPAALKRHTDADKEFKARKQVGTIQLHIEPAGVPLESSTAGEDEDGYDATEGLYTEDRSGSKYGYMYGARDYSDGRFCEVPVYELVRESSNSDTILMVDVPAYSNRVAEQVVARAIVHGLAPAAVTLVVCGTMEDGDGRGDSHVLEQVARGKYHGQWGERSLEGVVAAIVVAVKTGNSGVCLKFKSITGFGGAPSLYL